MAKTKFLVNQRSCRITSYCENSRFETNFREIPQLELNKNLQTCERFFLQFCKSQCFSTKLASNKVTDYRLGYNLFFVADMAVFQLQGPGERGVEG
jgi:hypothetical protein